MASSLPRLYNTPVQLYLNNSSNIRRTNMITQVKAHSYDEGRSSRRSSNNVDSNMSVLREKMEMVKMRVRLEKLSLKHHRQEQYGWNYANGYQCNDQLRRARARSRDFSSFFYLIRLVILTFGFTCSTATFSLFLVSLVINCTSQ
ncbi:uncharacterized protein LOC126791867 [Argentina anserina]|uniref:uncharacterized protein LOC126791867 n=1 Tax=Argentina anserina TaxID=57926 RepID=UPI002176944B|nr:uncharacterized protein LOC126791867 [Potentilla anserina]